MARFPLRLPGRKLRARISGFPKLPGMLFVAFVVVLGGARSAEAQANVSNVCPSGTCDIATPVYTNVYWDTSLAKWDTDVAATSSSLTHARIDAFTAALVHSGYFDALQQYSVTSASVASSVAAGSCPAAPATTDGAKNTVKTLVRCLIGGNPSLNSGNTIVNVFLPPVTAPSSGWCGGAGTEFAEHDEYGSPVEVTLVPTNSACNSTFTGLTALLVHEMIEAATDPVPASPTGWKQPFWSGGSEIGDICQFQPKTSFLFGKVEQYWSDRDGACITGLPVATPVITGASVCGTGQGMRITLKGTFGAMPWDLASGAFGKQTLYLQISKIGQAGWSAGNIEGAPPDTVGFSSIGWGKDAGSASDVITIYGFDSGYGSASASGAAQIVSPGDNLTITVWSVSSGQSAAWGVAAPAPAGIQFFGASPGSDGPSLPVGRQTQLMGYLLDAQGCAIQGATVSLTASAGGVAPATVQTGADGSFFTTYTAPSVAQAAQVQVVSPVSASAAVTAYQEVQAIVPGTGTSAGGQTVTLHGTGFAAGNTGVTFNGAGARAQSSTLNAVVVTTPAFPLGGNASGYAEVQTSVNGIASEPVAYEYIIPGEPVLQYAFQNCDGRVPAGTLTALLYEADGSQQTGQVNLSAGYAALQGSGANPSGNAVVSSGAGITLLGSGPVTAANAQAPSLSTTQSFPVGSVCRASYLQSVPTTLNRGYLTESGRLQVHLPAPHPTCLECGGNVAFWSQGGDVAKSAADVVMASADPTALAAKYSVGTLSSSEVMAASGGMSFAAVRGAGPASAGFPERSPNLAQGGIRGAGQKPGLRMRVEIQRAVYIAANGRSELETIPIPEKCELSFPLSGAAGVSNFRILRLNKVGGNALWIEQPAVWHVQGGALTFMAEQTGIYALGRIVPAVK